MLLPFARPVACCCVLLGVVVQSLKPVKLLAKCKRTQQRPTLLGQQWWELLHPFARSFDSVGLSLTTSGFFLFSFFLVRNFPYLSVLANCLILSLGFHFRKQERIILFFVRDIPWLSITAINLVSADICIGNSMICSDIWHKYHEWYFEIVRHKYFTSC